MSVSKRRRRQLEDSASLKNKEDEQWSFRLISGVPRYIKDRRPEPSTLTIEPKQCLPPSIWQNYTLGQYLAKGLSGVVYALDRTTPLKAKDWTYPLVVKFAPIYPPPTSKADARRFIQHNEFFIEEGQIAHLFGQHDIAPKVVFATICDSCEQVGLVTSVCQKVGLIIQERMDMTLDDYKQKYRIIPENVKKEVESLLTKVYNLGYFHFDVHSSNIMVNTDGRRITKVRLIDFYDVKTHQQELDRAKRYREEKDDATILKEGFNTMMNWQANG